MLFRHRCCHFKRVLFLFALSAFVTLGSLAQVTSSSPPAAAQPTQSPSVPDNGIQITDPQAEPPANDDSSVFVFKKQVEEVVLHATVRDQQRRSVTNLDRSAFAVFEDGKPQVITSFRLEDIPVAMGIVIDNSGSMREKRASVNAAVMNLIRASNPADEVFVVNFGAEPYLDQDFTSDPTLLQSALQRFSTQGSTALYDAIVASDVHLKRSAHLDKKVLLVITDGQDNVSQETLQQAVQRLQEDKSGPAVYAIGLHNEDLQRPGRQALEAFASGTGGAAFFPQTLEEVDDITRGIAHDVRSQYDIGYKSSNSLATGYRRIQVEARAPSFGTLTVLTRSGYYAGESVH
jgi:Ca-activated chloride channel family protein